MLDTLDVRNAYNSARWGVILDALRTKYNTPCYLLRMDAAILATGSLSATLQATGSCTKRLTPGAAQTSIFGPDLWNVSYDGVLRMELPQDAYLSDRIRRQRSDSHPSTWRGRCAGKKENTRPEESLAQDKQEWLLKHLSDKAGNSTGRSRSEVDGQLDSSVTLRSGWIEDTVR